MGLLVTRVHVQVVLLVVLGISRVHVVHEGRRIRVVKVHEAGILKGLERTKEIVEYFKESTEEYQLFTRGRGDRVDFLPKVFDFSFTEKQEDEEEQKKKMKGKFEVLVDYQTNGRRLSGWSG